MTKWALGRIHTAQTRLKRIFRGCYALFLWGIFFKVWTFGETI